LGTAWSTVMPETQLDLSTKRQCLNCRFFNNDPVNLERSIPGLRVMGSGYSAVVSEDGLCSKLDRYLSAQYSCSMHEFLIRLA